MTDAAGMTETELLAFRNEVLNRRVAALEAEIRELEAENSGLLAEVARLKDRCSALAGFAASVRERAAGRP